MYNYYMAKSLYVSELRENITACVLSNSYFKNNLFLKNYLQINISVKRKRTC